jgi:predicted lipoprotein with Yx(FWY)xxD motif
MKTRILLLGATVLSLAGLTACGASGTGGGKAAGSAGGTGTAPAGAAVSVQNVSGVGQTLVDSAGKTLYFADQETGGTIKCTAGCLTFWIPATGSAADAKLVNGLGVEKRPDTGAEQLTFHGMPLYTFKLDTGAGQANGNDVSDAFAGTSFTWHAATTTAATPGTTPSTSTGGGVGY